MSIMPTSRPSDSHAFCKPTLLLQSLSKQERDILLSSAFTGAEWEKVFSLLLNGEKLDWLITSSELDGLLPSSTGF
jgi:hypothetical protein